jgi:hypothetical protein
MYEDATWAVEVGTDYEQIITDGSNFTAATVGPPQYRPMNNGAGVHATPRPVKVGAAGIYNVNMTLGGHHYRHPVCGANGIGAHRIDLAFWLLVNRGGVLHTYQFNDRYQWVQFPYNDAAAFTGWARQLTDGVGDSIPWTVQGSCEVYLHANDEVLMLLGVNTQYVVGQNNPYGDLRRAFDLRYYTFDIAFVKSGTSAGSITLHGLSTMAGNGEPVLFDNYGW